LKVYKRYEHDMMEETAKRDKEIADLTAKVEKLKGLLENVEKHVEVRRQKEVLIKKRNVAVSEMDQGINKATHESAATLHTVHGEACTIHVSKRSRWNKNMTNIRTRETATDAVATIE